MAATAVTVALGFFPNQIKVGPDSPIPELRGTTQIRQVYQGAEVQPVLFIDGSELFADEHYTVASSVEIKGDVPDGVTITAKGRVTVLGNVGENVTLSAHLPAASGGVIFAGPLVMPLDHGLKYAADSEPGVTVTGRVGALADISSNAGVRVGSADRSATLTADNNRSVDVGDRLPATKLAMSRLSAPGL